LKEEQRKGGEEGELASTRTPSAALKAKRITEENTAGTKRLIGPGN